MTAADAAMLATCEGARKALSAGSYSDALRAWLGTALQALPEGAFLRLGGRSFVTEAQGPSRVTTVAGAIGLLCAPGDRAARMARRCQLAGRPVWLFARAWRPILPAQEIRLLIRQRRLVAASQLHHRQCFPALLVRGEALAAALVEFAQRLCPHLHLADVVADVWLTDEPEPVCELVELNPAMPATGRALLGDDGLVGTFTSELLLLRPDGNIARFAFPELGIC